MAQDPKHAGPTPPQPEQQQEPPGRTAEMTPKPDHGEESYKGCGKLEDRAAIITGGDSGIGRAVAIAYAREGADILISYLPEEEDDARETARWVEQAGRRVVLVSGDIADQQHCESIVERAVSEFGKLDILVNNAAFQRTYEEIEDITAEEWDRTFRVNVHAMFYLSQAGRGDREHDVDSVEEPLAAAPRLRHHEGRDLELHRCPGADAGRPWHPR
jgi:short chain dehydrogenase